MMEKKHFIKLTSRYVPKNKLCGNIIDQLSVYDMTLCDSRNTAVASIESTFLKTVEAYLKQGGKALPPIINWYEINEKITGIAVADTVTFAVYEVVRELSGTERASDGLLTSLLDG